jgi:hypothetical protein
MKKLFFKSLILSFRDIPLNFNGRFISIYNKSFHQRRIVEVFVAGFVSQHNFTVPEGVCYNNGCLAHVQNITFS